MSEQQDASERAMKVAATLARIAKAPTPEEGRRIAAELTDEDLRGVDGAEVEQRLAEALSAELPLREAWATTVGYLARVRPGIPVSDGLADLTDEERAELERLLVEGES